MAQMASPPPRDSDLRALALDKAVDIANYGNITELGQAAENVVKMAEKFYEFLATKPTNDQGQELTDV
jgi:hypothetical protein